MHNAGKADARESSVEGEVTHLLTNLFDVLENEIIIKFE
jgi:hypothetical protein